MVPLKTLLFQADIEEMLVETQLAEDRAKKTMIDTARLAGMPFRKRPFLFPWNIDTRMRRRRITIMLILNVADELRAEQENANSCEKNRRTLEFKVDNNFTSVL